MHNKHMAAHLVEGVPSWPSMLSDARAYLHTVLLIPPHRPLSVVIGTTTFLSTSAAASSGGIQDTCGQQVGTRCNDMIPSGKQRLREEMREVAHGWSPSSLSSGYVIPRDASVAACATRIFDAATIFIADVIFAMFWTDRMRCFTAEPRTAMVNATSSSLHVVHLVPSHSSVVSARCL